MSTPQIEVVEQAGYYVARYPGRPGSCFGSTKREARTRLKTFLEDRGKDHRLQPHEVIFWNGQSYFTGQPLWKIPKEGETYVRQNA